MTKKRLFWPIHKIYFFSGQEPGVQVRPDCSDCLGSYIKDAKLVVLSHGFSSNSEGDFGKEHRLGLLICNMLTVLLKNGTLIKQCFSL